MIVLGIHQETAGAVYFDIHHLQVRQQEKGHLYVASGILGDGWYEGEISVTFGEEMEVTFADEWLDQASMRDFFSRVAREEVCAALAETLGHVQFYAALSEGPQVLRSLAQKPEAPVRQPCMHSEPYRRMPEKSHRVSSAEPSWRAVGGFH